MRYWMVFDIETIPDAESGRRLLDAPLDQDEPAIRESMLAERRAATGQSDFLKPPFHQVVAIAAALIDGEGVIRRLGPLGTLHDGEAALLRDFFAVIEELQPRLVGWNSSGFDIPTLIYRAIRHGIPALAFYRIGEPYHGYRKRFDEESHIDLMDLFSGYGASPKVTLNEMAAVLNVPGKMGVDGSQVTELFEAGHIDRIRQYCAHDVLTTTLVFMHYAYHRGWFDGEQQGRLLSSARRWVVDDESGIWSSYRSYWDSLAEARGPA